MVVRSMHTHGQSARVQEQACHALRNLAKNQMEAVAATGGTTAVVQAMAAHESSAGVQERGCGALA